MGGARLAVTLAVVLGAAVVLVILLVAALIAGKGGHLSLQLPVRHTESFDAAGIDLPPLTTRGPELRTADGDVIVLRGVMAPDPAALADDGRFARDLVENVAATGANVLRVPVHPGNWAADPDYLWRYLDPIVRWAGEEGLYVILDWHVIGNVATGEAPSEPDLFAADLDETREFWTAVARHFADAPHVLFELVNEPQGISPDAWRDVADELTALVRAQGAGQPVVVGGTEYARDLSWLTDGGDGGVGGVGAVGGIDDDEVVYATHVYPIHGQAGWDAWFGDVTDRYPLLLTEWGFQDENRLDGPGYLAGDAAGYGRPLLDALADEGASGWVACWWDDRWAPSMFSPAGEGAARDGAFGEPTRWGAFVLAELARD